MQYLKCDAPECDHHEDHEALTESMIDKPCPKCGANLLTRQDWNAFEEYMALVSTVLDIVPDDHEGPKSEITIGHHDGAFQMSVKPQSN